MSDAEIHAHNRNVAASVERPLHISKNIAIRLGELGRHDLVAQSIITLPLPDVALAERPAFALA